MSQLSNLFGTGRPAAPGPAAPASAGGAAIVDTTTQTFARDVLDASRDVPVLVDFWAPWCGPCKQLAPVIEKVVTQSRGRVKLVKMNIDEHPEVAGQLGIRSIPAVVAFKGGQPVDGFMGALPESQIVAFIDKIAGPGGGAPGQPDPALLLQEAEAARVAGHLEASMQLYAAVLQGDPENIPALAGLAQTALAAGDLEGAKETLAEIPADKANDPAVKAAQAAIKLAEQAAALGDFAELESRVMVDPNDHQARYDLALALNAKGHREAAVEHLIELFRRDRTWNEEAARKQLLQFFEAWGPKDPLTAAGRRKLSTVLFS
ncbi:thioredoxin [Segnochrobactraceae bacterium EtOH-i3]